MNKTLILLFSFFVALTSNARDFAFEHEGKVLNYTILDNDNRTCEVKAGIILNNLCTAGNIVSGKLIIPSIAYDGEDEYKVISIGNYAFYECSNLSSVTIPESITSIGTCAFYGCKGINYADYASVEALCNIDFNDSGSSPFSWDANNGFRDTNVSLYINGKEITILEIPNSVNIIKNYTFYGCGSLTAVTIPESVNSIGENAFNLCKNLTTVYIPKSVNTIGNHAFATCRKLSTLSICDGVKSIGDYAFYDSGLTSVNIPATVSLIGKSAFSTNPLTNITIPDGVTSIGASAFESCSSLESVNIPGSLSSIGASVFAHCTNLSNVTLQKGITSIGNGAFLHCISLNNIEIPESVEIIEDKAFRYCFELKSVTLKEGLTSIGSCAFQQCGIISLNIPTTVNFIGEAAFVYCDRLTDIKILSGNLLIAPDAFTNCASLISAEFSNLESLCNIVFFNPYSNPLYLAHHLYIDGKEITELKIPNSIVSIPDYTFIGCKHLNSVTIPKSVTTIGVSSFDECTGLNYVEYSSLEDLCRIKFRNPNSNPLSLAHHLYIDGKEITDLKIPNSITSIPDYTFIGCQYLNSVTIPKSVTTIGVSSFDKCTSLNYVEYSSLEDLCRIKFRNPYSNPLSLAHNLHIDGKEITELRIPGHISSIGTGAFINCRNLTSLRINEGVSTIGYGAFVGCKNLSTLTLPSSITYINESAFAGCDSLFSIEYLTDEPIYGDSNIFSTETYKNANLYTTKEGILNCQLLDPWKNFENIKVSIESGVEDFIPQSNIYNNCKIYNMDGIYVGSNPDILPKGIYIIKNGNLTTKIRIK